MLTLKPNCEWCDRDLPYDSPQAMICSYECTFCAECVAQILQNICPNCGGNFVSRPIRPSQEHRVGVSIKQHCASIDRVYSKFTEEQVNEFIQQVKSQN